MNILYEGSKDSIKLVLASELLEYFFTLSEATIYEEEMRCLFVELDDSVDKVLSKIDKLYFEACRSIESLLYLRSLSNKIIENTITDSTVSASSKNE